jgi:short-subunit dehydrogenase
MNICVIGAGTKGHFGNDFVNRARSEGHLVYTLSHMDHNDDHENHKWVDFSDSDKVVNVYKELIKDIDNIDILLYNSVAGGGPMVPENFTETAGRFEDKDFFNGVRVNVIVPYKLAIASLKKMKEGSKIVFMTTGMSRNIDNLALPIMATYAGSKAYQNFIMKALAEHNNKGVIVSSLAPFFPYWEPENYKIVFNKAYNRTMNIDKSHNGKIIDIGIGT